MGSHVIIKEQINARQCVTFLGPHEAGISKANILSFGQRSHKSFWTIMSQAEHGKVWYLKES